MKYGESYSNWKSWDYDNFGDLTLAQKKYFDNEIDVIFKKINKTNIKVLEIGFGNGSFLKYCKDKHIDIVGVELNQSLLSSAKKKKFNVLSYNKLKQCELAFDIVCAFDVLEHIPSSDVNEFFALIKSLLKTDGLFFARFPNGDSPFGLVNQNGDITHLTSYGSSKIRHIASIFNFDVVKIQPPSQKFNSSDIRKSIHRIIFNPFKYFMNLLVRILFFPDFKVYFFSSNLVCLLKKRNKT